MVGGGLEAGVARRGGRWPWWLVAGYGGTGGGGGGMGGGEGGDGGWRWRIVLVLGVAWVAGVVGWDEGPFAFAFDEGPAVVGFLGVVVAAEPVEEIEGGEVGLGVVEAVVVLEPVA